MTYTEIPTPALLLDLFAFEANLGRMMAQMKVAGKQLRPHAKAHKCPEIAKRQIAAGAIGVCVATVPEAELMAAAGIPGILLTSPLADPLKMARAVATCSIVAVDHARQAEWYNDAARAAGKKLEVLVDLDVGDHRTGARREQALAIAEQVDAAEHLELRGIQAYSVVGSHAGGLTERREVSREVFAGVAQMIGTMLRRGLCCDIVSGGSTGTWEIDTQVADLTELQAGSFVLMDVAYRREGLDFAHALNVLGTVVSANHEGFVTTDAGFKAFATDRGYGPDVLGHPAGAAYRWGGDEFGYVDHAKLSLGDRVRFLPPHCDPTVNLYDRMYAMRGDHVEAEWPVKRLTL